MEASAKPIPILRASDRPDPPQRDGEGRAFA